MTGRVAVLAWLLLLGAACARPVSPPPPDPAFAALGLHSIVVDPVAYAVHQPGAMCGTYIDEDLRSALVRNLRQRGYDAFAVGNSVPRSFSAGTPLPLPGDSLSAGPGPSAEGVGVLQVWIEEYWENSLCGWEGPKYLTMGAVGVLYAGSPPVEVWRGRARTAEQGGYSANELIWLTTERLTDRLLESLPSGLKWNRQR